VRERARRDENLNETLAKVFRGIEGSAVGTASEDDIKGLFDDLDVNLNKLGPTVAKRNEKLVKLLDAIGDLDLQMAVLRRQLRDEHRYHAAVHDVREDRRREDGSARDEQSRAELLEMADELDFLTVNETARQPHCATPQSAQRRPAPSRAARPRPARPRSG
jgi:hypothetical protein